MATLVATAVARPALAFEQADIAAAVRRWLGRDAKRFERLLATFATGLVAHRRAVVPLASIFEPRSFAARNRDWITHATALGARAARACLRRAGVKPSAVDHIVATSCTGFAIPGLDALIAHEIGLNPNVTRLPISAHGCAGGAVAIGQAARMLTSTLAGTGRRALVVAVELPSLTFRPDDRTPENIISAGLFGDGAGAALLDARPHAGCPAVIAAASRLYPDSPDAMGFRLTDTGLQVFLTKAVPQLIRAHAPGHLRAFLKRHGVGVADIKHWIVHPGGRKIVESFEQALDLGVGGLALTRRVLRDEGNLSSATVLFVLDRALRHPTAVAGDHGVLLAFGPGFGAEMLLLKWPDRPKSARSLRGAREG